MKIKRIFKVFFKTIGIVILVLLLTFISTGILLQVPIVQNFVAKIGINIVSKRINADISLENFRISGFNTIELKNFSINDTHNNHMLSAGYIKVKVKRLSPSQKVFHFKEVIVRDLVFNHIKYENSAKSNLMMLFPVSEKEKVKSNKPVTILGDYVRIYNWSYKLKDYNRIRNRMEIDFKNLYVTDAYGEFLDLTVINDSVSVQILNLALKEEKGFDLKSFRSDFIISSTTLRSQNMAIVTANSDFALDLIFDYSSFKSYGNGRFTDSVRITSKIKKNSLINLIDISQFTSTLAGADNLVELETEVYGPVNNMHIKNIDLSIFDVTYYAGDVLLKDVDKGDMYLGLDIKNFITNYSDIGKFKVPAFEKNVNNPKTIILPDDLKKLGIVSLSGSFAGEFDNFKSDISAETDMGYVFADIKYNKTSENTNDFNILLNGSKVNIGEILEIAPKVKTVDLSLTAEGTAKKFIPQTFNIEGNISRVLLEKTHLTDIHFQSSKDIEQFFAHISTFNEDLFLDASANAILSTSAPNLNSSIAINHANLTNLGLIDKDYSFIVGGFFNANLNGNNIDDARAQINGSRLYITTDKQTYNIGDIMFTQSSNNKWNKLVNFKSKVIDFNIEGNFVYKDLPTYFANVIHNVLPNISDYIHKNTSDNVQLQAFIDLKKPQLITFSIPDLDISPNTSLFISADDTSSVSIDIYSENVKFNSYNINELNFYSDYKNGVLASELSANNVYLGEKISDASVIDISDFLLKNELIDNFMYFDLMWHDTIYDKNSHLKINSNINKLPVLVFNISDESFVSLQNNVWNVFSDGDIEIGKSFYSVDNLHIGNSKTKLHLNGAYSEKQDNSLNIDFTNLDISPINFFLSDSMPVKGILNGNAAVSYSGKNPYFSADLGISDIFVKESYVGDIMFNTEWKSGIKAIDIDASLIQTRNNIADSLIIIRGDYFPLSENGDINGNLSFNNFNFSFFEPFVSSAIENPKGYISGNIDVGKNIHSPSLSGMLNFRDAGLKIKYTDAAYTFSDSVFINPKAISFDRFKVFDEKGRYFDLSGNITHTGLKDFGLSLNAAFDRFTFLDNSISLENQTMYGSAILSGLASLSGNFNELDISADVSTNAGTEITINLNSNKTASQQSFINFVTYDEDSVLVTSRIKKDNSGNLKINAMAELLSNAHLNIILPYSLGDMRINGTGNLAYKQDKDSKFSVVGDYFVNSGNVKLNYQNFVQYEFGIKEGGGIIFNGDPMNASMSIEAVYQTRASLAGILTSTDGGGQDARVPVDCIISFSGVLSDPEVSFSIELPGVNEDTKAQIFAAIDINDQTAVAEQVFYLMLLKSFYTTNNLSSSNAIGNSSLQILSGQISSMLSNISRNIDFGVNYKPGDDVSAQEVEFMFKAGLFDNRVIIDGNIGVHDNAANPSPNNASNIVGDFNLEYKITKDGKLRAKVFNRSNDYNLLEQNGLYTQGLGLSYYTEFDKFSDLFRKKKKRSYQLIEN